ncbi:thioredoxin domain-containing protein [Streptomyces sp. NPDC005904]|uniref:DsbA family protein n=1 Tax=Streptomyces sp. NPDC005904 TaxID=3154570 RepID=UPI0033C2FB7D
MSEKNREAKRSARERLTEERERQKARDKRRRALIVGAAVVGVLGLAAVVGLLAAGSGDDEKDTSGPVAVPKGATGQDELTLPLGKADAKSTLTIWEDFRCPACKGFEDAYRSTVHDLADQGKLKVEYHLATLIDGNMGGSGSLRAANAAACAQDAGRFPAYHDVLFKNQPAETDDAFAKNDKLIELAAQVDGLVTDTFKKCVEDGAHDKWVTKSNKAFRDAKLQGTPTVLLNGKNIFSDQRNPLTPQKLRRLVQDADKG